MSPVEIIPPVAPLAEIARFPSNTVNRGVPFTDSTGDPVVTWAAGYVPPAPSRCYNYVLEAYNKDGTSGWNVNGPVQMCTSSTPGEIPQAPSNLKVGKVTATSVALTWRDNSTNETGYRIEYILDNVNGFVIDRPANTAKYTVTGLARLTTYYFRVQAYNADGPSAYSETVSATTMKK